MRISDWSSDVCSSDLRLESHRRVARGARVGPGARRFAGMVAEAEDGAADEHVDDASVAGKRQKQAMGAQVVAVRHKHAALPVEWAAAAGGLDVQGAGGRHAAGSVEPGEGAPAPRKREGLLNPT